jgi:fimbrial isopeptide formation D2 family protein/LPXTG-motif cell wall-anchored protein
MKTMKKIASILLVLMMIQALAITAFAEGTSTNSITVTDAQKGETYKIYKLFELSIGLADTDKDSAYSYYLPSTSAWNAFFTTGEGKNYIDFEVLDGVNYAKGYKSGKDAAGLAKAAAAYAATNNIPTAKEPIIANSTTVAFTGLDNGYWLITSSLGTVAMTETTPSNGNVTVDEKNERSSVEKTVKEDSSNTFGNSNDAQVGDVVNFKSVVSIVKASKNVVYHDTMTSGLTFNGTVTVKAGATVLQGEGKDYTFSTSNTDDCTFEIAFTKTYLDSLTAATTDVTIEYSATLNKNAANGTLVPQTNKAVLKYGNNSSVENTTTTTTHKFSVYKHANEKTENLAGARFALKRNGVVQKLVMIDERNYRIADENDAETATVSEFITVASGDIVIWGVDADTVDNDIYTLDEIKAPDGYNKLSEEKVVKVSEANDTRVDVINNAGSELPGTGGMGTTIFYVFGGTLVLAAIVLLVAKKRINNAN